jgi:hypothetical protein
MCVNLINLSATLETRATGFSASNRFDLILIHNDVGNCLCFECEPFTDHVSCIDSFPVFVVLPAVSDLVMTICDSDGVHTSSFITDADQPSRFFDLGHSNFTRNVVKSSILTPNGALVIQTTPTIVRWLKSPTEP